MIELTEKEMLERSFNACMDSVNLINAGKPEFMNDDDWAATVAMNKDHLRHMLEKNVFQEFDTTPLQQAVA